MKTEKQWQQIQVMDQHKCEISVLHSNTVTTSIHLTNKNVKVNLKEYFVVKINYRNLYLLWKSEHMGLYMHYADKYLPLEYGTTFRRSSPLSALRTLVSVTNRCHP